MLTDVTTLLTDKFGPLGPLLALGLLGLALIVAVLPTMLKKPPEPFAKLKAQRENINTVQRGGADLRRGDKTDKLEKFANFLEPQDIETMTASRMKMLRAGYRAKNAVRMFHFAQLVLGIGLLIIGVIYAMIVSSRQEVSTQFMIMATIGPGGRATTCRNTGSSAGSRPAGMRSSRVFRTRWT